VKTTKKNSVLKEGAWSGSRDPRFKCGTDLELDTSHAVRMWIVASTNKLPRHKAQFYCT